MFNRHARTALLTSIALALSACAPATSRFPSAIVSEPTTLIVPNIIYKYNSDDPANPILNL